MVRLLEFEATRLFAATAMPMPAGWTLPDDDAALGDFDPSADPANFMGLFLRTDGAGFRGAMSCGLGRRDPPDRPDIQRLHAEVATTQ